MSNTLKTYIKYH